ncbi:MAG: hypothetical protein HY655_09445 [Acidobacteria bacterium]|nr:hypothetical protein [Acidobacteriota bacterium]
MHSLPDASHHRIGVTSPVPRLRRSAHRRSLLLVAVLNAAVLVLTAQHQIYDTNFYSLWEATALLAGDHPYRDFFEWGIPLQALVSLAAQVILGNRLISEFAVQWLGIIAGSAISFHVGLRASGSAGGSLVMLAFAIPMLATTALYHYPKLLLYPMGVWLAWRYMDAPGVKRAAVVGMVTAVAFLFRHDHGVYIGGAAALAVVLTRVVAPRSRSLRSACVEGGVSAATALALIAPWLVLVHTGEGLPAYVESRLQRYAQGSPYSNPYVSLWTMNPIRPLTAEEAPRPEPGIVSFEWQGHVDEAQRQRIVVAYGLRLVQGPDATGRWQYEVQNVFDPRLRDLQDAINNTSGIDWQRLSELRWRLPARADSAVWLQQTALLVPLLLLAGAGLDVLRSGCLHEPVPADAYRIALAAALLFVVDWRLFREPGYVAAVTPLTAALSTRLLAGSGWSGRRAATGHAWARRLWPAMRMAVAAGMVVVTGVTTFVFARTSLIFTPWRLASGVPDVFAELTASPPIDGFAPREEVFALDRLRWNERDVDAVRLLLRYIHDCTAPGDRVLVTGQTPFQVGYYVERPIAGGHLFWHEGFRSDPVREQQSLELLQRQSVPFAYSTHDPVLEDLKRYPRILAYFRQHYVELEGSRGLVLVDTRRQPRGTFGAPGFPCFR